MPEAQDPRVALGMAIREFRARGGLSQEGLAQRAGLHRTYIGGIERGERNPALLNLVRIAGALGISLSTLVEPLNGRPK